MVRGKFRVEVVAEYSSKVKEVTLSAVSNDGTPENERFHKFTPSGTIKICIDNPPASEAFKPGVEMYVDFTPVSKAEQA